MIGALRKSLLFIGEHTGVGKRILRGMREAKVEMQFEFRGLPSGNSQMLDIYKAGFSKKAPSAISHILDDKSFQALLKEYAAKNKLLETMPKNLSMEEITLFMLQKGGVGPSKFAQIISSDAEMMSKFSPEIQEAIKQTRSNNPFSRTLSEAQDIVNRAFSSKQKLIGNVEEGALVKPEIELIKPLKAGTVGEAYLARTTNGEEIIVKMIKQNVDAKQLEMEEQIYARLIYEFAPNEATAESQIKMLQNLYKDWRMELDFTAEFKYNKELQKGAKRYRVADITRMSEDGSCILMEKAQGISMEDLIKMLEEYKRDPAKYFKTYAKEIEANQWLQNPERVISELPTTVTKAFDEQFMFMKSGGTSIMHGDPHTGNYFISEIDGVLTPIFIDTGNCVLRGKEKIIEDISFLANYFVGNSKGLAEYFVKQCRNNEGIMHEGSKLLAAGNHERALIDEIAKDIQKLVFQQKANITDVDKITRTMQSILEKHGLNINPETATALKAQMQFYTGINEAASLSGKTIDVATIVKDMPQALMCMLRNSSNPFTAIKDALNHSYNNQTQASKCIYQFLAPKCDIRMSISYPTATAEKSLAVI